MSAENVRWVVTDRRTHREILNEIATSDTPVVIVSAELPPPAIMRLAESVAKNEPLIHLLAVPRDLGVWQATNGWPEVLALLVLPPASFSFIVDHGSQDLRTRAARQTNPLWDWLIQRQVEGEAAHRTMLETSPEAHRRLCNLRPRHLVPRPASGASKIRLSQIERLGGVAFPPDHPDAMALRAGLFQWHDALDESHACSQSIEGQGKHRAGDYWHAIMHRREPDYANSKYWFRHVGRHPIFPELGEQAAPLIVAAAPEWRERLLRGGWDPFAFVDFCEAAAAQNHSPHISLAESIQELEMLLLLASTYADATA